MAKSATTTDHASWQHVGSEKRCRTYCHRSPAAVVPAAASMLKPGGRIYVTQTFQHLPSPVLERVKPWLRALTTIDFGRLTYHTELQGIVKRGGLVVLRDEPIPGSIHTASQTVRMLVLRPASDS